MKKVANQLAGALFITLIHFGVAFADESSMSVGKIIGDLQQNMYTIGETKPKLENYQKAETEAIERIRKLVAEKGAEVLVEKNAQGEAPIISATYFGYVQVNE